ncbi:metal-dependent hydrolase [Carboxydothermus pertinax]|uniref:UPF0173 metal-dependent hydrolase cpu_15220 n=1 Tax=Carboxydothermus pertinax TaxID=870242 RepID=A0A1L8CVT0_9THEO|nr:metal-dependent hydrolase [Carboxydothermus pertinax]GAV23012.1 metal-dependent hydrolase [Carboxydothermus pertinax]
MKITFLGHAGFFVEAEGLKFLFDPFLTGNPVAAKRPEEMTADYIFVSHGHGDHLGDTVPIAQKSDATVIGVFELCNFLSRQNVKTHPMHIGGRYNFGKFTVKLTPAWHGSSFGEGPVESLGNPCGFLLTVGGQTLYHTGDTGVFYDMKLIAEIDPVDILLLPIGGNFTMDIKDALKAVELIKPRHVIPMHYNTWPLIAVNAEEFRAKGSSLGAEVHMVNPGETVVL